MAYFGENACRAWTKFNASASQSDSFNVSSIDDDGVGIFGVNMGDSTNTNYCVLTGYSQQKRTNPNRVLFIRRDSISNSSFDVEINIGHGGTFDVDFYFVNVMADT